MLEREREREPRQVVTIVFFRHLFISICNCVLRERERVVGVLYEILENLKKDTCRETIGGIIGNIEIVKKKR